MLCSFVGKCFGGAGVCCPLDDLTIPGVAGRKNPEQFSFVQIVGHAYQ